MKAPAFQFYVDDFMGGTRTMKLDQKGAYMDLLCIQWGQGYVTEDDFRFVLTALRPPARAKVRSKFMPGHDGHYRNPRMEAEREKQRVYREKQANNGRASAQARLNHRSTTVQPTGQPKPNSPSPTPSPTPINRTIGLRPTASYNGHLTPAQLAIATRYCKAFGPQWDENHLRWMARCRKESGKAERVIAEVESAIKETRINTTPAQYAEQMWKEFK